MHAVPVLSRILYCVYVRVARKCKENPRACVHMYARIHAKARAYFNLRERVPRTCKKNPWPEYTRCICTQEKVLKSKTEELSEMRKRLDNHEKLKEEMKVLKEKLVKTQQSRIAVPRMDVDAKENEPPATPTRRVASRTPLAARKVSWEVRGYIF